MNELLDRLLGLSLEGKDLQVGHMCLRAVIVFIVAILLIRLGSKRFMGQSTALDVLLGIAFGSMISRAITGTSPFFPTLAGSLTFVLMHWLMSAIALRWPAFGHAVKGHKTLLVKAGQIDRKGMKTGHITEHDLHEALRANGKKPDVSEIEEAHLERNGDISIIMKS